MSCDVTFSPSLGIKRTNPTAVFDGLDQCGSACVCSRSTEVATVGGCCLQVFVCGFGLVGAFGKMSTWTLKDKLALPSPIRHLTKNQPSVMNLYLKLAQPSFDTLFVLILIVVEVILTTLIVIRVPYTEIDWVAYMQEVTTYQNGERDYANIRGDTGPLVYPAGFLYLYGWLKSVATKSDLNKDDPLGLDGSTSPEAVRRIQWVFVVCYVFNCMVVLALYQKVLQRLRQQGMQSSTSIAMVWCWRIGMGLTCLSKRIHSIFVLRLFNDAPSMILLHVSMYLFACCDAWTLGCVVFSLAVSIKMNVLLFAPGLLLLLLQKNQSLLGTIRHLSVCASVQLALGWPFLTTYPISYVKKAFEFDRVFFFMWTVNWKFLPEEMFVSKPWALVLLLCHLGTLALLAKKWWAASLSQKGEWMCWMKSKSNKQSVRLSPEYVIYTMFVSNYIGIVFARTLHYQFYCWYFYSLPMMHLMATITSTMSATSIFLSTIASIVAIFGGEYAFNVFPATEQSSMILQISHAFLMLRIFQSNVPTIAVDDRKVKLT
jgi:alpha-1,3-mannosyltransferase